MAELRDYIAIAQKNMADTFGEFKKYSDGKWSDVPSINQNAILFVVPFIFLLLFVSFIDAIKSAGENSQSVYFDQGKLKIAARIERDTMTGLEISLAKWRAAWSGKRRVELELDSFGGAVDVAEQIARMIEQLQRKGIVVHAVVPKLGVCMSACTMILAAASERVADPTALFMFHGVQRENRQTGHGDISPEGNAMMHRRLKSVDEVFDAYLETNQAMEDFSDKLYVLGSEMDAISCTYVQVTETYPLAGRLVDNVQRNLMILGRPAIPARAAPCQGS